MRFTPSHEWINVEGTQGTVGVTAHAKELMGDIVFIELPQIGQTVIMGEEACVFESTKAAIDVNSPVSGRIIEINRSIKENPAQISHLEKGENWLYRIELTNPEELNLLLTKDQYEQLLLS